MRAALCLAWLGCATWARAETAVAATSPGSSAAYTVRLWQTEDGLPQNSVTAIVQTRDGYVWVGTYGGLARFDGVRFRTYDTNNTPELGDARVVALYEDSDGTLWIGHDTGVITRYRHGHFEAVPVRSPHANERVMGIDRDGHGRLWVLREGGTVEPIGGGGSIGEARPARPQVLAMARARDGALFIDDNGRFLHVTGDDLQPVPLEPAQHTGFVLGVGPATEGGVWTVRDWSIQRRDSTGVLENRGPCPWGTDVSISQLFEMQNGTLAVGTVNHGLYLCPPDGPAVHLDHTRGLPQDWVRALCEDREGNLWLGSGSAGLVEVVPTAFTLIAPPDRWQDRTELAVMADHTGALWVGTEGAGLYRYRDGEWSHFGAEEGVGHPFVWALAETGDGSVWAGTWGGGVFRYNGQTFQRVPQYNPDAGPVFGLSYAAQFHELWLAGSEGLIRWPDGGQPQALTDLGGEPNRISTVVRDAAGVVWFGGPGTGLGRLENGKAVRFHRSDGLPSETILCLHPDVDGALWIGTSFGGLVRFKDGRFATIGTAQGLPSNVICYVADDGRGYLWLSTHHGLARVAKAELNRCANGESATVAVQAFDRNDGLPTIEFSGGLQAAGCVSPDGRIWFPSSKGVVGVDPARIRTNRMPPPVVLEGVYVDGRFIERVGPELPELRLRPDHQRLEFQFTGLSLTAPGKVSFKYRLEGIDAGWVDAGTRRTASYSRLPGGRYVFHVIARNNDGVWNRDGASLVCIVLPFFWETWWFLSLVAAVVLGLVVWAVRHLTRRRLQRRLEELERRHALERERARIARDIHDDIGATLTRITMLSQCLPRAAETAPGGGDGAQGIVEQIYETAREATRALDEIVWAVNPRHDSLEGLASYMGKFAQDFLGAAGLRCRLDVPVALPEWIVTADVRHNLFLAFKEALNNIVKHAGATEVHIGLAVAGDAFVLTVEDNGRGFDAARARAGTTPSAAPGRGGNGLGNLRRRLAAIGGECSIDAQPGRGTRIAFVVPRVRSAVQRETADVSPHVR